MQIRLTVDIILTRSSQRVKITSDRTVTFRKRAWINELKLSRPQCGVECPLSWPLRAGLLFWRPRQAQGRQACYLLSPCTSCFCRRGIHKLRIFRLATAGGTLGAVRGIIITPAAAFRIHQTQVAHHPHLRVGSFSLLFQISKLSR